MKVKYGDSWGLAQAIHAFNESDPIKKKEMMKKKKLLKKTPEVKPRGVNSPPTRIHKNKKDKRVKKQIDLEE